MLANSPKEIRSLRTAKHPKLNIRLFTIGSHAGIIGDRLLKHIDVAHIRRNKLVAHRGHDTKTLTFRFFIGETIQPRARSKKLSDRFVDVLYRLHLKEHAERLMDKRERRLLYAFIQCSAGNNTLYRHAAFFMQHRLNGLLKTLYKGRKIQLFHFLLFPQSLVYYALHTLKAGTLMMQKHLKIRVSVIVERIIGNHTQQLL